MTNVLAVVGGLLTLICVVPYVRDVRRGTTRPQRTSWLTFAVLSATATAAQMAEGATAGAFLGAGATVGFSYVFALSIRRGDGGHTPGDVLGLVLVAAAVGLWAATNRPLLAVVGVVAAEGVAGLLTVRKAVRDPGSETLATWVIDGLAGAFALAATDPDRPVELVYPANHLAVNAAVALAVALGRRRLTLGVRA